MIQLRILSGTSRVLTYCFQWAFYTEDVLARRSRTSSGVTKNINDDCVTASKLSQYQDPETQAAKWNSAIINCIVYTCPTVTCQMTDST